MFQQEGDNGRVLAFGKSEEAELAAVKIHLRPSRVCLGEECHLAGLDEVIHHPFHILGVKFVSHSA